MLFIFNDLTHLGYIYFKFLNDETKAHDCNGCTDPCQVCSFIGSMIGIMFNHCFPLCSQLFKKYYTPFHIKS